MWMIPVLSCAWMGVCLDVVALIDVDVGGDWRLQTVVVGAQESVDVVLLARSGRQPEPDVLRRPRRLGCVDSGAGDEQALLRGPALTAAGQRHDSEYPQWKVIVRALMLTTLTLPRSRVVAFAAVAATAARRRSAGARCRRGRDETAGRCSRAAALPLSRRQPLASGVRARRARPSRARTGGSPLRSAAPSS